MSSFFEHVLRGLKKVGHVAEHKVLPVAEFAIQFSPMPAVAEHGVEAIIALVNSQTKAGDEMNPLEMFAITMVLGLVQQTVKNPVHAAQMRNQLVGVADQIYMAYGLTPASLQAPAAPPAVVPPAQH